MPSVLTVDRSTPSRGVGRLTVLARFRLANAGLAALHLAQALLVVVVADGLQVEVTTGVGVGSDPVRQLSIGTALGAYFLAAAVHHSLSATVLHTYYQRDLQRGRNRIRWTEFAFSGPVFIVVLALYLGISSVVTLGLMAGGTLVFVCCSWLQEEQNPLGRQSTTMVPFWAGVAAAVLPWGLLVAHVVGTSAVSVSGVGLPILLSTMIFGGLFSLNQWLQYRQVGAWSDYLFSERTYLALSFVAKSALAWQIVVGTSVA
jgi:hypothetical protein